MRARFILLSVVAVALLLAGVAAAASAQTAPQPPQVSFAAPLMSPAAPAAEACGGTDLLGPQLSQATPRTVTCGSCSNSCVGIPVNSNCILGFNRQGTCQLQGGCKTSPGGGTGVWCQCISGPPP